MDQLIKAFKGAVEVVAAACGKIRDVVDDFHTKKSFIII